MNGAVQLPNGRRDLWLPAVVLGAIFAALYFVTRTPGLDEWDSVQFALGVNHFDLWQHQPHPPGYPVYIGAGWLATHLFGLDVTSALQLPSAIGGGLSVAGWFVIIRRKFSASTAWLSAITLGCMVIMWMSATKVLTDPLGAGLMAATLALAGSRQARLNVLGGFVGALAAGARPQNFGVIALMLALSTWYRGGGRRPWAAIFGAYLGGCLCWLVPMAWIQMLVPKSQGDPFAYFDQLLHQWRWRMDKPSVYVGAEGFHLPMLRERLERHVLDWLKRGFGCSFTRVSGWLYLIAIACGWLLHILQIRRDKDSPGRTVWKEHGPWALVYIATIFICLPGDQRYYLPIFPLLVLATIAGWQTLPGRWRLATLIIPFYALWNTVPLIGLNHYEPAPPVAAMRYLQAAHARGTRSRVWLILRDNHRHADWYATDFYLVPGKYSQPGNWPHGWEDADAIYTDDPLVVAAPPPGRRWRMMCTYTRSALIYRKHNSVILWRLGV